MKNPWLYILGALLWLFAGLAQYVPSPSIVIPAFAQCSVTGPQTANPPNVVSGVDANCNLTQRQVNYTDLAFPALFGLATTASNQVTVALGDQTFYLDQDPGYQQGYTVQVVSLIDPQAYMTGRISALSTAGGQTQITVSVTQDQGDSFTGSSWYLQIVSSDAAFIPVTGVSLSSLTFGTGAGQISQGGVVNLTTETGLLLNNSHVVVVAIGSPTNYFRGISQYNSSTGALTIYTTDSSGSGAFTAWSLFAQDGPPINANQIALSQTPVTMSAIQLGFTIQAGQNLPLQGPVVITALSATANQMLGTIQAYQGTGLSVLVPSNGLYGSGNYAAWSILNTGPPQTRISLYQMNGLQASGIGGLALTINSGSIRDSSDTVDLIYNGGAISFSSGSSSVVSVAGPGTISSSLTAVTGAGTSFLTTFSATATLTDLNNQLTALNLTTVSFPTVISAGSQSAGTTVVTDNTHLTTSSSLGVGAGTSYTRGGVKLPDGTTVYGIMLCRNDADGSVAAFATSFTPSGTPDLPSGYTYYRVIGYITIAQATGRIAAISQPLAINVLTTAGDTLYFGSTVVNGNTYQIYSQRLGIGSSGQVLEVSSGLPAWGSLGALSTLGIGTGLQSSGGNLNVNLPIAFSQLTADVNLNNTSSFFTGPQIAQGASGVWWVTGKVTIGGTAGDTVSCKLWDGTTAVDSSEYSSIQGAAGQPMTLAGILSNMAGNIRVSCKDATNTTGKIKANATGVGVDSTIWGMRIQ